MPEWRLQDDLTTLTGEATEEAAIRRLFGHETGVLRCEITRSWHAAGSETYQLHFEISSSTETKKYTLKACTAVSFGISLTDVTDKWLTRRALCVEAGISTPKLFASLGPTLVEEFIPYTLADALRQYPEYRMEVLNALGTAVNRIAKLGFMLRSLHDLRSRGRDVVVIDFGSDLGTNGNDLDVSRSSAVRAINALKAPTELSKADLALVFDSFYESS